MGNSNSIAQFTPNDIDLRHRAHWQYLSQQRATFQTNAPNGNHNNNNNSTTSIKVLPELNDSSGHLRSTDNGVILFNGGTISARGRDSVGVVRSKSISTPQHEAQQRQMKRHNTQLDMGAGVRSSSMGLGMRRDVDPKLFGSEPDLRLSPAEQNVARNSRKFKGHGGQPGKVNQQQQQQQQQQLQQQQQRDYDSSRFGWRPRSHQPQPPQQHMQHHHQERTPVEPKKPRLFKTREETKKVSSKANQSKLATEASDVQSKKPSSGRQVNANKRESERSRDDSVTDRVIKVIGNRTPSTPTDKMLPKAEVLSKPIYRREKSFDISLLLSRSAQKGTSLFPNVFRKTSTTDKNSLGSPPPSSTNTTTLPLKDKSVKPRRASQPPRSNTDTDFQKELQEATRRRSMLVPLKEERSPNKSPIVQKSIITTQSPVLKAISKPPRTENAKPQMKSKAPKPPQSPKVEANKIQLEVRNGSTVGATPQPPPPPQQQQQQQTTKHPTSSALPIVSTDDVHVPEESPEKPVKSFYYGMPETERNSSSGTANNTTTSKVNDKRERNRSSSRSRSNSPALVQGDPMNGEEKVELTAIESFAESIFAMKNKQQQQQSQSQNNQQQRDSTESAVSSFADDPVSQSLLYPGPPHHQHTGLSNHNINNSHHFDEDTLEGISLQLRPTLPKKQFEIPRFSPAAAWRLLSTAETSREVNQSKGVEREHSDEDDVEEGLATSNSGDDDEVHELNQDTESRGGVNGEEQIERVYREPVPGLADNKSGDSGISGDGGMLELGDSSPTNNLLVNDLRKLGPFLQPWTPQQDLEDDSSSDPDPEYKTNNINESNDNHHDQNNNEDETTASHNLNSLSLKSHRTTMEDVIGQKHVFSLSLPRDNQNSNLSDKGAAGSDKHFFSSLQKAKMAHCYPDSVTTTTGRGGSQQAPASVSGSDNWFLGRSQPNSIEKNPMPSLSDNEEAVCLPKITAQQQPAIQPPSFNYLAGGCHFMYLPNRPTTMSVTSSSHQQTHPQSSNATPATMPSTNKNAINSTEKVNNGPPPPLPPTSAPKVCRENLQDDDTTTPATVWNLPLRLGGGRKGHRFTFQSTVRQIERRKLADKLSREAEEREVQRLSEVDAMQKVEEEFQKKRAREKASIRQQLRLFSLESAAAETNASNFCPTTTHTMIDSHDAEYSPSSIRREPDGAAEASLGKINGHASSPLLLNNINHCHTLTSTSLMLELSGYRNHSNGMHLQQLQQQQQQHQQTEQYQEPFHYQNHHHQSMATGSSTNILTRDYSKFPYREFLK